MNQEQTHLWGELYRQAARFKELAPWKWMYDSDVFGVQNPADGDMGYCCVFGAGGEIFGLAVYLGDQGLKGYYKSLEWADNPSDESDLVNLKKCLLLTFESRSDLQPPDLGIIKSLGLKFEGRNGWPLFRHYEPGYYPWYLTPDLVLRMTFCLEQANQVVPRFRAELSRCADSVRTGRFFARMYDDQTRQYKDAEIKPAPMKEMVIMVKKIDVARLEKIASASKRTDMAWELDTFHAPTVVEEKNRRPYFPTLILMADRESLFVLDAHMTEPGRSLVELHEELLKVIEKSGVIPKEIHVRKEELQACLGSLAERLGIRVRLSRNLPAVTEAHKGMTQFFGRGRR